MICESNIFDRDRYSYWKKHIKTKTERHEHNPSPQRFANHSFRPAKEEDEEVLKYHGKQRKIKKNIRKLFPPITELMYKKNLLDYTTALNSKDIIK